MSDPRGHGFKRGNGHWHRPNVIILPPQPSDYGWQATIERNPFRIIWVRGNYHLTGDSLRNNWQATHTITGRVWDLVGETIADVTAKLFGEGDLTAPAEITLADFYGVSR